MITGNTLRLFTIANLIFASMLLSYVQAQTTVTVPDAPIGLSGVATSSTSSKLSWTAPANNGGSIIIGYKIEVKIVPGDYVILVSNNANTTYKHMGLITGKTYIYKVSAINSAGSSIPSNEVVVKPTKTSSGTASIAATYTPTPSATTSPSSTSSNTVQGAPTGLVATMTSSTSILLSWSAPSSGTITGYKIEFKTDADQWSVLVVNTGTVSSYSVTGLATGTIYTYRVSAINSAGSSNPSNAVSISTKSTTTPTGLTATAISPTSILLSWSAPTQNFGQTITGYKIEKNLGNNYYDTVVSSTGSTSTIYTVTGLTTGKLYTFAVSAVYGATSSGQSTPASATPTSTSKAPANIPSENSPSLLPGTPSVQMPSKNQISNLKKKTETTTSTTVTNPETAMEKAARDANAKAIANATATLHKRLAAAKNGTSITPTPSAEKQKALQKLKELQAENDKLNQRIKNQLGNR